MTLKGKLTRKFQQIWLIRILLCLALATVAVPAQVTETAKITVKNFGKVDSNYYRGAQPKKEEIAQLKSLGIKTVIDLRKDSRREAPEWVRSAGLQYFNIPLRASRPATEEQTSYFLSLVNNPANWPVFVHCKGGRHRTGALTAVYRITHDKWTADQAYQEMKAYDFHNGFFGGPAEQVKFVYSFYRRYSMIGGQH